MHILKSSHPTLTATRPAPMKPVDYTASLPTPDTDLDTSGLDALMFDVLGVVALPKPTGRLHRVK